jgi:hypothetical protein
MLAKLLMRAWMLLQQHGDWRRLLKAATDPEATQVRVLQKILRENRETEFGRDHNFDRISSYEEFARTVPVVSYEALRPYIEEQLRTGEPALTAAPPAMYAKTSGTTGEPKYVPLIQEELRKQKRHTALLTYRQYAFDRRAFAGRLWVMAAAAEEGRLENGVPFGSASGFLYANMAQAIAAKYLIPPELFSITDNDLKYRMVLRLALAERDITYLSAANPTTLARICFLANEYGPELACDIGSGSLGSESGLSPEMALAMRKRLHADPGRALELREIFARDQPATFADLWPSLRLVSTWTGGNCGVAVENVRTLLPVSTRVVELGYLSSEFRGSLTVDCETGAGLPTLQDYFLEFIEPEYWDAGNRECCLLHQLEAGRDYYVIVTTPSGLYRYFINDIVRVVGRCRMTPTIRFVQKGKGVTNITGEKLYENHVVEAIGIARKRLGIQPVFYLMLADVERQAYCIYLELDAAAGVADGISNCIDLALAELNDEYRAKSESGRLMPVEVVVLKAGTGEAYRAHCIREGQKEGQFKMVTLQYTHQCDFPFRLYVRGR